MTFRKYSTQGPSPLVPEQDAVLTLVLAEPARLRPTPSTRRPAALVVRREGAHYLGSYQPFVDISLNPMARHCRMEAGRGERPRALGHRCEQRFPKARRRTPPRLEAASLPRTVRRGCPKPQKTLYRSPPSRDSKTGGEAPGPRGCPSTTAPRSTSGLAGALNTGPDSLGSGPQFAR